MFKKKGIKTKLKKKTKLVEILIDTDTSLVLLLLALTLALKYNGEYFISLNILSSSCKHFEENYKWYPSLVII